MLLRPVQLRFQCPQGNAAFGSVCGQPDAFAEIQGRNGSVGLFQLSAQLLHLGTVLFAEQLFLRIRVGFGDLGQDFVGDHLYPSPGIRQKIFAFVGRDGQDPGLEVGAVKGFQTAVGCKDSPDVAGTDLVPLFETIINYIPAPQGAAEEPLQLLVSSIDYNEYVGRIAVGRVERGTIKVNQEVTICDFHNPEVKQKGKVVALYEYDGLGKNPIQQASAGEIVALSGMADITIGRTLCAPDCIEPLPFVKISDPTIEMTFAVNDSPFAGKEGKYVTSRNIRDRLEKELMKDVSLHVTAPSD